MYASGTLVRSSFGVRRGELLQLVEVTAGDGDQLRDLPLRFGIGDQCGVSIQNGSPFTLPVEQPGHEIIEGDKVQNRKVLRIRSEIADGDPLLSQETGQPFDGCFLLVDDG